MDIKKDRTDSTGEIRVKARISPDSIAYQVGLEGMDSRTLNRLSAEFGRSALSTEIIQDIVKDAKIKKQKIETEKQESAKAKKKESEQDRADTQQEMWEMANLALWNTQMTIVGGVLMTNGEAQKTRKHIIDNDEYYAQRAVQDGRIEASEEDEYKSTIRRIYELKDREGRGIASVADKKECERLRESRVGRVAEHDVGAVFEQQRTQSLDSKSTHERSDSSLSRISAAPADDSLFQSAPKLTAQFEQAKQPSDPVDQQPENLPPQPAPKVAAMGLGI